MNFKLENEFQLENETHFQSEMNFSFASQRVKMFLFTEIKISNSKKSEVLTLKPWEQHTSHFRSVWSIILFWKYAIQKQEENTGNSPGTREATWNHCLLHLLQRKICHIRDTIVIETRKNFLLYTVLHDDEGQIMSHRVPVISLTN